MIALALTLAACASVPPVGVADACGASELRAFVGHPRSDIPVPVDPSKRRVACADCAVSSDRIPDRATIRFDDETGVIKSINCG